MTDFINGLKHASHLLEDRQDCKRAYELIKREIIIMELENNNLTHCPQSLQ